VIAPSDSFHWRDGERLVVFGRGTLAEAPESLGGAGYTVLSTPRAMDSAPLVVQGAREVLEVPAGRVDELAADLRPRISGELLVALGGGRVIDVAKALAAADPPRRVAAIPTTLSGAEMTAVHRHVAGVPADTPRVRPAIVLSDPVLSASQPVEELAASAANALGHAAEGPLTPLASPVPALAAMEATRLIVGALPGVGDAPGEEPDRDALALGALLAGYVIGSTGYGLHHVLAQTLVRFAGISHGTANAVMLPHSLIALARRSPAALERFGEAMGGNPPEVAARVCALSGVTRLRDADVTQETLERCATEAAVRPELVLTPPAADQAELRALYAAAW
jgi:alcohol dehydrogenase class IV